MKTTDRISRGVVVPATGSLFPFEDSFEFNGQNMNAAQVLEVLEPFLTEERVERAQQVIAERSFGVLPIVEGLYDMGNLGAVCRSADALGFGAVHCIANNEGYKQSRRSSAGSEKWLDVRLWDTPAECISAAQASGYRVVATHLREGALPIHEVDWTAPTAVLFGNERDGVSDEALAMADGCVVIPMAGFVESYNISVAAALVLYEARRQRIERLGGNGDLSDAERRVLQAVFALRTKGRAKLYVQELLERARPGGVREYSLRRARRNARQKRAADAAATAAAEAAAIVPDLGTTIALS